MFHAMTKSLLMFLMLTAGFLASASEDLLNVCGHGRLAREAAYAKANDNGPKRHYGRARPFDVKHIKIDVALDFEKEKVGGTTTTTISPIGEAINEIVFDAVDLTVSAVRSQDGDQLDFEVTLDKLKIYLREPLQPGEDFSVAVDHSTTRPVEGMYFRTERMGYDAKEVQAWTQGEAEKAHYWFPCFDFPNERSTTEIIATIPERFIALSNGRLVESSHDKGAKQKTFHWIQEVPHVVYLVSLVVGPFVEIADTTGDVPLYYYVAAEDEAKAKYSFGKTPDMMKFIQEQLGVPYPYERYSQVCVVDFVAGGMENTSITTLMDSTLHDEAAHLTFSSDGLVVHELAHQWWGDLLTCRDWSHLWLNEGFASYAEMLYAEHRHGQLEFQRFRQDEIQYIVEKDTGEDRAPIVRNVFEGPMNMFDFRSYEKGALVLHMLRRELGDELFWKCLKTYCERYRGKVVETNDFLRTIEEVSGRGMEQFFQQWVYSGGYPIFDVTYDWSESRKSAKVTVKQTQTVDDMTPLFRVNAKILFNIDGKDHIEEISIENEKHVLTVPLKSRPGYVRFDPEIDILKKLNFKKPKPMLLTQLKNDPTYEGRREALEGLARFESDDVLDAFETTLLEDAFWGVRSEVARTLGKSENDKALDILLKGLDDKDARVRRTVVGQLSKFHEEASSQALLEVISGEESPYVVAAAIEALGKLDIESAARPIAKALTRDSHREVIRRAALGVLADMQGKDSLKTIIPYTKRGKAERARGTAIAAVGRVGKWMEDKGRPRKALVKLLDDPKPRIRRAAVSALARLQDREAIKALQKLADTSRIPREQERATKAIKSIESAREQTKEVKDLRDRVKTLEKSNDELKERFDEIEDMVEAAKRMEEKDEEEKADDPA